MYHRFLLNQVLATYRPGVDPNASRETVDRLAAAAIELIDAKVPCNGPNDTPDFVLKRFSEESGWFDGADGKPTAARELFGRYVRSGYINLAGPVSTAVLSIWMSRQACPLEYAIGLGSTATDAIRALIAEGSNIDSMVARKDDGTIEKFIERVAPIGESKHVRAVLTHALMTRRLAAIQSESDATARTAPRRAHRRV